MRITALAGPKKLLVVAIVLVFSVVLLAGCGGGGDTTQEQSSPSQGETTTQKSTTTATTTATPGGATTKAKQETTTSSANPAADIVGIWDQTSRYGNPISPGTQTYTFYQDGTLQSTSNDNVNMNFTAQYRILDNSQLQFIFQDSRGTGDVDYSLNGDTLTMTKSGTNDTGTWQRTG